MELSGIIPQAATRRLLLAFVGFKYDGGGVSWTHPGGASVSEEALDTMDDAAFAALIGRGLAATSAAN